MNNDEKDKEDLFLSWCINAAGNDKSNGFNLASILRINYGYDTLSDLIATPLQEIKQLSNDLAKDNYKISAHLLKLKGVDHEIHDQDEKDNIQLQLLFQKKVKPQYKHHDYLEIEYNSKTQKISFKDKKNPVLILKRILKRFNIQYDQSQLKNIKFFNTDGDIIDTSYGLTHIKTKLFMVLKDNINQSENNDSSQVRNNNQQTEELVFGLNRNLSKWNKSNCRGFKIFGEDQSDKVCKFNKDQFEEEKHFVLSRAGISSKYQLIYKWN
eukprot:53305_1